MATDELSATLDGHQVIVDVSALAGVEQTQHLVPVIVVAVVVAVVLARLARPDRRPFLLAAVATGTIGAAIALLASPIVVGRIASWVPGLFERVTAGSVVVGVAGFACGALLSLVPLSFFTAPRRIAVATTVVGVAAFVVGAGAIAQAQQQRRTFVRALQQAFPLPHLVFAGQDLAAPDAPDSRAAGGGPLDDDVLPEVQVGRTRALAPTTWWQLGVKQPVLLGVLGEQRVAFPASDVAAWNLLDVRAALSADAPGVHQTTAVARHGPVRVVAPLRFRAVADTSPPFLPLVKGAVLSFARTEGPPGVTERRVRSGPPRPARGTGPKKDQQSPPADVVIIVQDEAIADGFRVADVHIIDGDRTRTERVVAKDGVLFRMAGGVFAGPSCGMPFLEQPTCACDDAGIASCARIEGDTIGALVRVGLLVATLGMSEVMGVCDGCGAGRELGLVRLP